MDERLKQRLVGAAVLVLAAVVFVPMLLDQSEEPPRRSERLIAPRPPEEASTRVVPLEEKAPAPAPAAKAPTRLAAPAPAAAKASTKSASKPAATPSFAVQLGSFSKSENARGLRDKLIARGYTAFVETKGGITRVYVGPQPSRAEAEKILQKLLAETKLKGIVVNFSG